MQNIIVCEFGGLKTVICANLPYYITSPVLMKLLESRLPAESITVMVQRRLRTGFARCPEPANAAPLILLSVLINPEKLFSVSRGKFMPAPKVDSVVIKLISASRRRLKSGMKSHVPAYQSGTRSRKTLANSLTAAGLTESRQYPCR